MDVKSRILNKKIVIWGIGILQTDLVGMFPELNPAYYIDDYILEKNLISVTEKEVRHSDSLKNENVNELLVILCLEDEDEAIAKLQSMGFTKENYILGEEMLIDYPLYKKISMKSIYIWGTGNTYCYYEDEINEFLPNIRGFYVSRKEIDRFKGKEVIEFGTSHNRSDDTGVIVASIYYRDIYKSLVAAGYRAGRDFLHLYTMLKLGRLSNRGHADYNFIDRRKGSKDLLIILSGYKALVWESVFPRVKEYVPEGFDVCVVTSGIENDYLKDMCEKNEWSYMSTTINHVSLVVNLGILLHPDAEYIYKMDEDIFVTAGVFETLKSTYLKIEQESQYKVGFVTPLIPVNGYGYVRLLEIFHSVELWEKQFGELKYTDCYCHHRAIHDNPKAASFMWGDGNEAMSSIDEIELKLQSMPFQYSICPLRYSIGFILFHRNDWIRMGMFPVLKHSNMGSDEVYICKYCLMQARVMAVAENAVAGHLSYGPQHKEMEEFYKKHIDRFMLPGKEA